MLKLSKFVITNTYKAFKELFKDIGKFITRVLEPATFPWASAYMTQVYYEIANFYLGRCIKKEVPFIEPTTKDLAYTTSNVKQVDFYDDIKENMAYSLRDWLKLLITPYSVAAPYKTALIEMKDRVEEHNTKFTEITSEELETKMMDSLDVYNSIFGSKGFNNE